MLNIYKKYIDRLLDLYPHFRNLVNNIDKNMNI